MMLGIKQEPAPARQLVCPYAAHPVGSITLQKWSSCSPASPVKKVLALHCQLWWWALRRLCLLICLKGFNLYNCIFMFLQVLVRNKKKVLKIVWWLHFCFVRRLMIFSFRVPLTFLSTAWRSHQHVVFRLFGISHFSWNKWYLDVVLNLYYSDD